MRRSYRKHSVVINNKYIQVKNWYRDNSQYFKKQKGVPTSEQIGAVLIAQCFNRTDSRTEVIYRRL